MMRNNKILEIVLILLCLVGMASLLILVVYRFQIVPFAKKDDENLLHYFYILLFMSTGILIHECGHVLTAVIFGSVFQGIYFVKKNKLTLRCKVTIWIPEYVSEGERWCIYWSGLMLPVLIIAVIVMIKPRFIYFSDMILWITVLNVMPISRMNSDGYKACKHIRNSLVRIVYLIYCWGLPLFFICYYLYSLFVCEFLKR